MYTHVYCIIVHVHENSYNYQQQYYQILLKLIWFYYETLSDTYIVWFKVGLGVRDRIVQSRKLFNIHVHVHVYDKYVHVHEKLDIHVRVYTLT